MKTNQLTRLQHPKFGDEIRALLGSTKSEDKEIAGIVISELDSLTRARARGQRHPKEERLVGCVSEIEYLKLYPSGYSIRVYYYVLDGVIWVLAVDPNKRVTKLSASTETMLLHRLHDVKTQTKKRGH